MSAPTRETLIVNLFAGPGAGKSTLAAGLFYKLKMDKQLQVEYIQEYAKDKTWQSEAFTLQCQPYITAKQLYRQHRLLGKVDVVITDAPLLHGLIYPGHYTGPDFEKWLVTTFHSFWNQNILLVRDEDPANYEGYGRSQTFDEARAIDERTKEILETAGVGYCTVPAQGHETVDRLADLVNAVYREANKS
jgi:predicted ATPase